MPSSVQSDPASTAPKPFVLVLMPFLDTFNDVYQIGIREACSLAGAHCERVDEQIFDGSILERIFNQIAKADAIVADMTGRNANVFYEVGYAHALGKRTVLLTRVADDIPFDLKHFPHIVYGNSLAGLRTELKARIAWAVSASHSGPSLEEYPLEYQIAGVRLREGGSVSLRFTARPSPEALSSGALIPKSLIIKIDVENTSDRAYDGSQAQVALKLPRAIAAGIPGHNVVSVDSEQSLVVLGTLGAFTPLSWRSLAFSLPLRTLEDVTDRTYPVTLIVFGKIKTEEISFFLNLSRE